MPAVADLRNPSAHNEANQPLEWSTLDEAAKWLAAQTGRQWDSRDVLNAAIRYPVGDNPAGASNRCTAIGIALPHGHEIKSAVINVGEGRAKLEKMGLLPAAIKNEPVIPLFASYCRPVALLQLEVRQLLAAGWAEVAIARSWDLIESAPCDLDIVAPPFVARLDNVGTPRRRLMELAVRWVAGNRPIAMDAACHGAPDTPQLDDLNARVKQEAQKTAESIFDESNKWPRMSAVAKRLELLANEAKKRGDRSDLFYGQKGPHKESWYKAQLIGWQPEK